MKRQERHNRRNNRVSNKVASLQPQYHETPTPFHVEPLVPKNGLQRLYLEAMHSTPYVLCSGHAGTGKTYMAGRVAAQLLKSGSIKRIVLLRPAVSASKSLGFFKGTHEEKMRQWLAPILGALEEEFRVSELEYMLKEGVNRLIFCPLETAKGNSWKDAFIIVDEAEDCTLPELKTLLTRLGTNSTMVICGDITQVDLKRSGMSDLLQKMSSSTKLQRAITHIAFDEYEHIVRCKAVRQIVEGFDEAA